jgi:hypothetical protein
MALCVRCVPGAPHVCVRVPPTRHLLPRRSHPRACSLQVEAPSGGSTTKLGMPCTTCLHPTCKHSPAQQGVLSCPECGCGARMVAGLHAACARVCWARQQHGATERPRCAADSACALHVVLRVSCMCPACVCAHSVGMLVLDPVSGPRWRLDCSRCSFLLYLPPDLHDAKVSKERCEVRACVGVCECAPWVWFCTLGVLVLLVEGPPRGPPPQARVLPCPRPTSRLPAPDTPHNAPPPLHTHSTTTTTKHTRTHTHTHTTCTGVLQQAAGARLAQGQVAAAARGRHGLHGLRQLRRAAV